MKMNEPTGRAVGNALEVIEALECLQGGGPPDLRKVVLDLSEKIAGISRGELEALIDDGSARRKFDELVAAHGGNPADLPRLAEIHKAPVIREVFSESTGSVRAVNAGQIGQASLELGAGRSRAEDTVDFAVGFDRLVKSGEELKAGDMLARIHARSEASADAAEAKIRSAISVS